MHVFSLSAAIPVFIFIFILCDNLDGSKCSQAALKYRICFNRWANSYYTETKIGKERCGAGDRERERERGEDDENGAMLAKTVTINNRIILIYLETLAHTHTHRCIP